ncbi:MAG: GGDEF domain-containing protein [Candidatus Daviesbacteria bacterium]|nr:GGDEF domain-containing protein [Candidatus Daviesbacteria bacterium]
MTQGSPETEAGTRNPHREFLKQRHLNRINRVISGEITAEQAVEESTNREIELEDRADHDGLTGLLNFQGFVDAVTIDLKTVQQNNLSAYLAFLDIDKLKEFNDTRGKMAGNDLIRTYADVLIETTGREQFEHLTVKIGRFGGDECVIFVIGASNKEMLTLAEEIRIGVPEAVKRTFNEPSLEKTVSVGITPVRLTDNIQTLFARGDEQLKQAKLQRNHIVMEASL